MEKLQEKIESWVAQEYRGLIEQKGTIKLSVQEGL